MMCCIKYILYTMHTSLLPFQNLWVASTLCVFFLVSFPSLFFFNPNFLRSISSPYVLQTNR